MRVDAHFHVWDLERNSYPWLQQGEPVVRIYGNSAPLRHTYLVEDFIADARPHGIGAGVHVQCGMDDPLQEALYVQRLADEKADEFPIMIVGHADLVALDAAAKLEQFAQVPNVRGVRYSVAWDADPLVTFAPAPIDLSSAGFTRAFAAFADLGLRYDCMLYATQMHDLAMLCARHPSTRVIINHAGLPLEKHDPGLDRWRAGMRALAGHQQVSVKISGLGMVRNDWTEHGATWAQDVIGETIGIFGVERCMFASNYPVERLSSSYAATYRTFETAVKSYAEDDRDMLFGANAFRLYGF